jgi:hypothetical protein
MVDIYNFAAWVINLVWAIWVEDISGRETLAVVLPTFSPSDVEFPYPLLCYAMEDCWFLLINGCISCLC